MSPSCPGALLRLSSFSQRCISSTSTLGGAEQKGLVISSSASSRRCHARAAAGPETLDTLIPKTLRLTARRSRPASSRRCHARAAAGREPLKP